MVQPGVDEPPMHTRIWTLLAITPDRRLSGLRYAKTRHTQSGILLKEAVILEAHHRYRYPCVSCTRSSTCQR